MAKNLNPLGYSIARMLKVLMSMALTKLKKLHFPMQRDHGGKMGKYWCRQNRPGFFRVKHFIVFNMAI